MRTGRAASDVGRSHGATATAAAASRSRGGQRGTIDDDDAVAAAAAVATTDSITLMQASGALPESLSAAFRVDAFDVARAVELFRLQVNRLDHSSSLSFVLVSLERSADAIESHAAEFTGFV
jgi:hypothetical protein